MVVPVTSGAATAQQLARGAAAEGQVASNGDFATFLRMLTAQLKNQDPLNPMEGSDFAVQLATFSGVEQQAQTNSLLNQLTQQLGGGVDQLAGWLGREVRVKGPVWFGNQALTLDISPDPRADSVQLVTLGADGREVMREEIGTSEGQVDWFGSGASGDKLPDGVYSFRIESWQNGEKIAESAVAAYSKVVEAELSRGGTQLVLEGGATAMADQVETVRSAKSN